MGLNRSDFWFENETEAKSFSRAELLSLTAESKNLEEQVAEIFETLRMPVYHYLLGAFGNAAEAEEITQDAFLQLYKSIRKGQVIRNVRFWIFRVSHNLAINRRKHDQFIAPLSDDSWSEIERILPSREQNPEQKILEREKYDRLFRRVKRLSLKERQSLYLRTEGFKYKEIGKIMNIGTPTVGEYLRRGINKLSERNDD